jgi:hypothetical protein
VELNYIANISSLVTGISIRSQHLPSGITGIHTFGFLGSAGLGREKQLTQPTYAFIRLIIERIKPILEAESGIQVQS